MSVTFSGFNRGRLSGIWASTWCPAPVSRTMISKAVDSVTEAVQSDPSVEGWFESTSQTPEAGGETYLEAIRLAMLDELNDDERVLIIGEDVGAMGGAFRATAGLFEEFGGDRVIDSPLAETALVGAGIGLAVMGMRPIVELQFADFISCAYDQLVTEAAKLHYRFGIEVPLVVRCPSGAGLGAGPFHSQSPEGVFAGVAGLKIVAPGTVQDAYDLLRWAVSDPNPVLFFEHKALYRSSRGELIRRKPNFSEPRPSIVYEGSDATVVTYGSMVRHAIEAAELLSARGVSIEVIDLRSLAPLDLRVVFESVVRTSRLLIAHEDTYSAGIGGTIASRVVEACFWDLDAPVLRVTAPDTPVPFARPLEEAWVPGVDRLVSTLSELMQC